MSALLRGLICLAIAAGGCSVDLLRDVDADRATAAMAALRRGGVSATKVVRTAKGPPRFDVRVHRNHAATAWRVLRTRRRASKASPTDALSALVASGPERRDRRLTQRGSEVARLLEARAGVVRAAVVITLAARPPFAASARDESASLPTAAVVITMAKGTALTAPAIRRLVAHAVERLTPDRVEVAIAHVERPAVTSAPATTVAVGPFDVAPASRLPLLATLIAAVIGLLGLGLTTLWLARRQ